MVIHPGDLSRSLSCALAKLHGRAFAGRGRGWSADEIAGLSACPGVLLIVVDDAAPSGFGLFRQVGEEAELLTLAVDPEIWNNGLGRALVSEGCSTLLARGCDFVFLEVACGNDRALSLYRSIGFLVTGERRNYYNADETGTAYLMRLSLSSLTS
jgi:ribosomal-protein-alanine N-acetyltransferase